MFCYLSCFPVPPPTASRSPPQDMFWLSLSRLSHVSILSRRAADLHVRALHAHADQRAGVHAAHVGVQPRSFWHLLVSFLRLPARAEKLLLRRRSRSGNAARGTGWRSASVLAEVNRSM